jgi:hypothetical protein
VTGAAASSPTPNGLETVAERSAPVHAAKYHKHDGFLRLDNEVLVVGGDLFHAGSLTIPLFLLLG